MRDRPDGTLVEYDGLTYVVTGCGDVYVRTRRRFKMAWQELRHDGERARAVRHQYRNGHVNADVVAITYEDENETP